MRCAIVCCDSDQRSYVSVIHIPEAPEQFAMGVPGAGACDTMPLDPQYCPVWHCAVVGDVPNNDPFPTVTSKVLSCFLGGVQDHPASLQIPYDR
jgi:hypothetical protein